MAFAYTILKKNTLHIINIQGNLIEKGQASQLMGDIEKWIEKGKYTFVINMDAFQYMNSTGLNILVSILTKARNKGGDVVLCCIPAKIKELLTITKLNTVFTTTDNLDDAIQKFNSK